MTNKENILNYIIGLKNDIVIDGISIDEIINALKYIESLIKKDL